MNQFGVILARAYSLILHPILMPLYSVALLFVYTNFNEIYFDQVLRFLTPVLVFSVLLPSLFIFLLWKMGYVMDISLSNRYERIFPYLIFLTSNLSLVYFFYSSGMSFWFISLITIPSLLALIAFILNFFSKISAHMLGIGGLVGGVLSVCLNVKGINPSFLFIVLFVLAGFLGVSRLYLRKSTAMQIYIAFLIGLVVSFGAIFCGTYINLIPFI